MNVSMYLRYVVKKGYIRSPPACFPPLIQFIFPPLGALFHFLKQHPDIAAPQEETHFFDREENFKKGTDFYISMMPKSYSHQVTLEKVINVVANFVCNQTYWN